MKLIQLSARRIEAALESIQDSIIHSDKIPSIMECIHTEKKKRTQTKKDDETIANTTQGLNILENHIVLFFIINNLKFEIQLVKFCHF